MTQDFDDYYEKHLLLHKNSNNRLCHVIGNLATLIWIAGCFTGLPLWMLLLAPFLAYPFGWVGHKFFEVNQPFRDHGGYNVFYSRLSDLRMMWDMARGRFQR